MKKLQKKLQLLSFILVAGLLFFSVTIPVRAFIQKPGTVNEAVTLRQNADASSNQLMELTNGQAVTVNNELPGADGATWYQIFVNGTTLGYVPANTITISEDGGQTTTTPGTGQTMETITVTERIGTVTASSAIRVRAQATTSSEQIASMEPNDTFRVLSDVNADDGYVWYEVEFDDHGTMVHGYVRSDLAKVEEVTHEEQVPVEDPATVPSEPAETAPYSVVSQVNAEGTTVWYLKDSSTGEAKEITSLLTPQETKSGNGLFKIIIVILVILLILAAAAATFFYMRWQDAEEFIDELYEKQMRARKQPQPGATRTVPAKQPVKQSPATKPATTSSAMPVQPAKQSQTVSEVTAKPAMKPAPTSTPVSKPVSQPTSTPVSKPVSQQATQDILPKTADIVKAAKQELQNKESGAATAPKSNGWKSKNFLTDDDDLEFDFLDMEDK